MAVGGPPVASRCRCVFTWQTPALRLWLARGILLGLVCVVLTSALQAYAGPAIPGLHSAFGRVTPPAPNTVPQARELVRGVKALEMPGASRLVVHQDERRAVIDWQSFDIGSDAAVHFDQRGNADWEALNRIFDQNPSQIFGQLTADGKVFLINPNGILFAPDAKVNLHALVASALNLDIDDFDIGLQRFTAPDGQAPGPVANYGTIETDSLGSVVLIGADAENGGRIVAPSGKVALVAGDAVRIASDGSGGLAVTRTTGAGEDGVASNREGGEIQTDSGWTGMFGRLVNQDGMIQAVTAIRRNGQIVLAADETVATGPYSTTTSPVSDSDEAEHESFGFSGGHIDVIAARIEHRGEISAPSGTINLSANERIYLDAGSRVDVSGNWVDEPASRNVVQAQLNSVELRDDYGQKGRVLQGATVSVDVREGSAVGDVSGHLTAEELTAEERSTTGGIIQMTRPANDFILRAGGTLDFAGGGFRFQEGQVETTKLLSGQRLYDLSEAPQWLHYDALLDRQETVHARYGVVDEFTGLYTGGAAPLKDYSTAYVQGSDAGQLLLMARHVVLDGDLLGGVVRGYYQTEVEEADGAVGKREPVGGIL
ncbi:MAG: filamentous hemagglutinin N-terminal domain-containing protein, partial [Nitrospirota bacterium]